MRNLTLACVLGVAALGAWSTPSLAERVFNPADYGAVVDGETLCTEAIQKAIDECAAVGGGVVRLPKGKIASSTIFMKSNVTLDIPEGLTLKDPAMWVQHYMGCDDVTIRGITVFAHVNKNNDGIDIDGCHNVLIEDCQVDTDDDAICLKSSFPRTCENVTVRNCTVSSRCNALKCGTDSFGGFKNITITDCVVKPSARRGNHEQGDLREHPVHRRRRHGLCHWRNQGPSDRKSDPEERGHLLCRRRDEGRRRTAV